MASEIDICNLALARLGDSATVVSIDPPEGSAQAEHCERFYPVARDSLLEMHAWKFATRRATLSALATDTWNWSYAYAVPSDMLKPLAVLPLTAASDAASEQYEIEGTSNGTPVILTDLADATLRYLVRATDTTKFSPLFVDALGWLLASHLAGPIIKGDAGAAMAKQCAASFRATFSLAANSDANQRRVRPEHSPAWMAGR